MNILGSFQRQKQKKCFMIDRYFVLSGVLRLLCVIYFFKVTISYQVCMWLEPIPAEIG